MPDLYHINIMYPLSYNCFAQLDFSLNLLRTYSLQPASGMLLNFMCLSYYYLPKKARLSMAASLVGSQRAKRGFDYFLSLITDFHLNTSFANMLVSSMSTCKSFTPTPLRFSSFSNSLQILLIVVDLTQSVQQGWQGSPAKSHSTQLAIAMPMIAGIVPKTGTIRILQLSNTLKDQGYFSCSSLRGSRSFSACWQEKATLTPLFIPFFVSARFSLIMRLSYLQSEISRICIRVGSLFMPAPPEQISLIFLSLHSLMTYTFASRLSMQSITQSMSPTNRELAFSTVTQLSTVSICTCGRIQFMQLRRHCTFEVPTSLRTAQL